MKHQVMLGLAVLACGLLAACQGATPMQAAKDQGWSRYGAEGMDSGTPVALGALEGSEKDVIVEGTIVDVCQTKGCWMRVSDDDRVLFVKFKDYGFFVPRNATGHKVVMHGTPEMELASVEEMRHYAEDAGESAEEIAKITEPTMRVTFYADSVYIMGDGLDAPHSQ